MFYKILLSLKSGIWKTLVALMSIWQTEFVRRHIISHTRARTEANTNLKLNGFQGVCEVSKV